MPANTGTSETLADYRTFTFPTSLQSLEILIYTEDVEILVPRFGRLPKRLGHEIKDFLVRAWREAIYGNNDLEALLQPAIATK